MLNIDIQFSKYEIQFFIFNPIGNILQLVGEYQYAVFFFENMKALKGLLLPSHQLH